MGGVRPSSRGKPLTEEPELNPDEIKASIDALCEDQGIVIIPKEEYERLKALGKEES